ncbi:MAG TPA: transglycosylase SLT domain-containing protein [Terriglobia bacterium]|nr:transglycosylase SLT domain-containing protein [Terriglobia bacterium]
MRAAGTAIGEKAFNAKGTARAVAEPRRVKVFFHAALLCTVCAPILALADSPRGGPISSTAALVPSALHTLAARADHKSGWAPLARYAASARDRESKGLAYLVLGYREYQAGDYSAAMDHLARAEATGFLLADYATYYRASSASLADEPEVAARLLADFARRFPGSSLDLQATRLLAWSLIGSHRPADALAVLGHVTGISKHPPLELLVAQARENSGDLKGAVEAYQDLYYRSPAADEAGPAATALKRLEEKLGAAYPAPSGDMRLARARALENDGRWSAALTEYEGLLRDDPASASAVAWRLGRDRCWAHLGRASEAGADLAAAGWPEGEIDAERGLVRLRIAEGNHDEPAAVAEIDRLAQLYPQSPSYAAALNSIAFFYTRQEDWGRSAVYNARLVDGFPGSDLAPRALWESAWAAYVAGEREGAEKRFLEYLGRYPVSFRVPAGLYWVGRLEELQGRPGEARSVYALLSLRFHSDFYAVEAEKRLRDARMVKASLTKAALPPEIETVRRKSAVPPEYSVVCARLPDAEARRGMILAALRLDDLARHELRVRLDSADEGPEKERLRLDLSRVEREAEKYDTATYHAKRALPGYVEYDFSALPADVWALLYPQAFWPLVRRYAAANHLDPYLVMALIRQESGFNAKAISGPGARGLMQLLPPTARLLTRRARRLSRRRVAGNLLNPSYNLRAGCSFFAQILHEFNGNLAQALAAYNAGPDRVHEWLNGHTYSEDAAFVESIPFPETRAYVETILRDAVIYRRLMTGKPRFRACGPHS